MSQSRVFPWSVAALCLFVTFALAGCISPGSEFAVLDREPEEADAFPTDLPAYAYEGVIPGSSRFVGEHDGDRLYLARGDDSSTCLMIYPDTGNWVIGCGGGSDSQIGAPSRTYALRPDGAPPPAGATRISENVYLLD